MFQKIQASVMRRMITVPDWMQFNPSIVNFCHRIVQYIPFFLPHHKDYYGFRHLATANHGLFVDVGANDGISALGFRQINNNYHILSIEPNPAHEQSLRSLARRLARFDYKIVGAGSKVGNKILYIPVSGHTPIDPLASLDPSFVQHTSTFYSHNQKVTYTQQIVHIIPLDSLALHPDIIKIDIEGYELDALRGLSQTIRKYRPYLLIESTPKLEASEKKFFRTHSYALFTYDYQTDLFSPHGKNNKSEDAPDTMHFENIFCIPKEKIHLLPMPYPAQKKRSG